MTNRETFHFHPPSPGIVKPLDPIRGKDQVQIERSVLELDEIFSALDLGGLLGRKKETEFTERHSQSPAIVSGAFDVEVGSCVVSGKPRRIAPDFPRKR